MRLDRVRSLHGSAHPEGHVSGQSGTELAARLDLPAGPPRAFALFAHCFTCGKDIHAASRIANALTDLGFGVLRFDFTGLGMSDGEFENTNFTSNTEDLVAAADWLRATIVRRNS